MSRKKDAQAAPQSLAEPPAEPSPLAEPPAEPEDPAASAQAPPTEPPKDPAVVDATADLKEIRRRNDRISGLRGEWAIKDADAKAAKKALEGAQDELNQYIVDLDRRYPLFDRPAPSTAEPSPATEPAAVVPAGPAEAWRATPLLDLCPYGVSAAVISRLALASLTTLGALLDHGTSGQYLTTIEGIGEAKAKAVEDAVAAWWRDHPALVPATNEPPGDDVQAA